MNISARVLIPIILLLPLLLPLGGCGCGFDCNNDDDNNNNSAQLTLGLSDSIPEDLKQVVIEVDSITFRRSGADDVVVDTFTIPALNLTDEDTFQVDLLDYPGTKQLLVITSLSLDTGSYSSVRISIVDDGIENSYVQEANDELKAINVSNGTLSLDGMELASGSQAFTVEFSLAQSLQLQTSGNYLLATDGIRVENNKTDATLSGEIDDSLFDTATACAEKGEPQSGNRVYLYEDIDLEVSDLADVFTSASSNPYPTDAIAPFTVASMFLNEDTNNWEYAFGYLPAGDYTMAFSCDTATDTAVNYEGLDIPLPADQIYEITLDEGESAVCDLAVEPLDC